MENQYNAVVTSDRIKAKAKEMGITISHLNLVCGLSENTIKRAGKSTEGMKAKNLFMIAETLDCSVDYLLGRTSEPDVHPSHADCSFSEEDIKLLSLIHSLDLVGKSKVIVMIDEMSKSEK